MTPTHRLRDSNIDLLVTVTGGAYFRVGCRIKDRVVCYRSLHDQEDTVRTVQEFNRMFEPIPSQSPQKP
jgi:hypothetical protein